MPAVGCRVQFSHIEVDSVVGNSVRSVGVGLSSVTSKLIVSWGVVNEGLNNR